MRVITFNEVASKLQPPIKRDKGWINTVEFSLHRAAESFSLEDQKRGSIGLCLSFQAVVSKLKLNGLYCGYFL